MSREMWIPFYRVEEKTKFKLTPLPQALSEIFCVANASDAVSFSLAVRDIARSCQDSFTVRSKNIEFPYFDHDKQNKYWPSLTLSFIGCDSNISKSIEDLQVRAEGERPAYNDREFWYGDLDPVALDFERRGQNLERSNGLPIGIIDKRNSVFIVKNPSDEASVTVLLPGIKVPAI